MAQAQQARGAGEGEGTTSAEIIDITKLKAGLSSKQVAELESLYGAKARAGEAFKDACEAVAGKAGVHPAVVKKYIQARASGKLEEQALRARQLQMLFDEL